MIIQLTTKSNLAFITTILIFLATTQYYFHSSHPFPSQIPPNPTTITNLKPPFPINNLKPPAQRPPFPINPYEFLHMIQNPDGTITRQQQLDPTIPPNTTLNSKSPTLSHDVLINPMTNMWVRIFLPRNVVRSKPDKKLPIVVFVRGGGFVLFSVDSRLFHFFCDDLARKLDVLVVSVEYRLAPEFRLPAAYEDVLDGLMWVKDGKNEWLKNYGDFSRCILVGQSAGGNIAYNVMLKAVDLVNDLKPLYIIGWVLIQPAFGGPGRTESELRGADDVLMPLNVGDLMWEMALPVGVSRSHEFCDPTSGGGSDKLGRVVELGWPVVVTGCEGDGLFDRQVHVAEFLKSKGVNMKSLFSKGGFHSASLFDPIAKGELFLYLDKVFKEF